VARDVLDVLPMPDEAHRRNCTTFLPSHGRRPARHRLGGRSLTLAGVTFAGEADARRREWPLSRTRTAGVTCPPRRPRARDAVARRRARPLRLRSRKARRLSGGERVEDREESGQTVVFICWSGKRSQALAAALRDFLGNVIQSVQAYMSDKDIEAGEAWDARLTEMIRAARFGIACVTAENRDSPWLHFEAGALSNAVEDERRLCPYLLGLRVADLRQPLARFQAKEPNKIDTLALIESINTRCAPPLQLDRLRSAFSKFWPDFEEAIKGIEKGSAQAVTTRGQDEKIDEILTTVRDLARVRAQAPPSPPVWSPGWVRSRLDPKMRLAEANYGSKVACPICRVEFGREVVGFTLPSDTRGIHCPRCGRYEYTREALTAIVARSPDRILPLQRETLAAQARGEVLRVTGEMIENL
jgi:rhodanese-related sulfurtransferase